MRTPRIVASLATIAGLALLAAAQACLHEQSEKGRLQGPVVRRVLSRDDTDPDDFVEMSPSLDGRQLAYVSMVDGSVHVRDLATGKVRRLVGGLPTLWQSWPRWSPDGRRLAVATRDQATGASSVELIDVATNTVEGVPGMVDETQGVAPVDWAADGRLLLCVRGQQLELMALDEGTITVLADSVGGRAGSLSPDGRFAVYAARSGGVSGLFISPVAGGAPQLIKALGATGGNPKWSPTGDAVAYESMDGIWVVPVREGTVVGTPQHALVTSGISLQGWTKRGLYFTAWGETKKAAFQVRMNPSTGAPIGIDPESLAGGYPDEWFGSFSWSPDMQRVAFVHWHPAAVSIYSAGGEVAGRFEVSKKGYAEIPSWSADGSEVLVHVISPEAPGTDTIRAVNPETGRVRDLEPRIPDGFYASYSADGRRVAFARQASSAIPTWKIGEVVVATPGANDGQVVATDDEGDPIINDPGPRLSPRGDHVTYVRHDRQSQAPSPAALWIVGCDGRNPRQVATAVRFFSTVWDPSGRFVAYTMSEDPEDSSLMALHIVEVETGADRRVPLPSAFPRDFEVTDWSDDGSLLGLLTSTQSRSNEYWVMEGLVEGG